MTQFLKCWGSHIASFYGSTIPNLCIHYMSLQRIPHVGCFFSKETEKGGWTGEHSASWGVMSVSLCKCPFSFSSSLQLIPTTTCTQTHSSLSLADSYFCPFPESILFLRVSAITACLGLTLGGKASHPAPRYFLFWFFINLINAFIFVLAVLGLSSLLCTGFL